MLNIPGCIITGYISTPEVNDGRPVPVFTPITPADRPSINTLDGWNAAANQQNVRSFQRAHDRKPRNSSELATWIKEMCEHP